MVDYIDTSPQFWERIKPFTVLGENQTQAGRIVKEVVLPELAHPRFQRGQTIRESFTSAS